MTNDALSTLLGHILDKLNRIEAAVADMKSPAPQAVALPAINNDGLNAALEQAVSALGRAIGAMAARQLKPGEMTAVDLRASVRSSMTADHN